MSGRRRLRRGSRTLAGETALTLATLRFPFEMIRSGEHERRPFYACESCSLVYARFERPEACPVCGRESFTEVTPREIEH